MEKAFIHAILDYYHIPAYSKRKVTEYKEYKETLHPIKCNRKWLDNSLTDSKSITKTEKQTEKLLGWNERLGLPGKFKAFLKIIFRLFQYFVNIGRRTMSIERKE